MASSNMSGGVYFPLGMEGFSSNEQRRKDMGDENRQIRIS
jgi:hypothetical protein